MKDPTPFTDFCNAVCAQVRFRPDRAAIQTELLDHLQDHADALKERGVPILDAREEARLAAGNASRALSIAASTVPAQYLLPPVLPRLRQALPQVFFQIRQGDSGQAA